MLSRSCPLCRRIITSPGHLALRQVCTIQKRAAGLAIMHFLRFATPHDVDVEVRRLYSNPADATEFTTTFNTLRRALESADTRYELSPRALSESLLERGGRDFSERCDMLIQFVFI